MSKKIIENQNILITLKNTKQEENTENKIDIEEKDKKDPSKVHTEVN